MEIWKNIPGYEGYQASNIGRIRTYNKTTYTEKHGIRHWKNRVLKPKKDKYNSLRVSLWKNNKEKTLLVARLIGSTFIENNLETNLTINHKDGNRLNNNVENLEWLSRKENIVYGFKNGQYKNTCKKCSIIVNGKKKNFETLTAASNYLNKNKAYISNIINRKKGVIINHKNITILL